MPTSNRESAKEEDFVNYNKLVASLPKYPSQTFFCCRFRIHWSSLSSLDLLQALDTIDCDMKCAIADSIYQCQVPANDGKLRNVRLTMKHPFSCTILGVRSLANARVELDSFKRGK